MATPITTEAIQMARAKALDAYSHIERHSCEIFSGLLGTSLILGGIVFFKITASHTRNRILRQLLKTRFNNQYKAFWNGTDKNDGTCGLLTLLANVNDRRNEIVHWTILQAVAANQEGVPNSGLVLHRPDFWTESENSFLRLSDIEAFIEKAAFVDEMLFGFQMIVMDQIRAPILYLPRSTWLEIFEQPLTYPPPDTHPIIQSRAEREIQRRASQEKSQSQKQ